VLRLPVREWAAAWAARNGCDSTPAVTCQPWTEQDERHGDVTGETWRTSRLWNSWQLIRPSSCRATGHDPQHTSRSPHASPQTGQITWTYAAPKGRVINNQPTVDADGTVYFGTWGSWIAGSERAHGLLYAVNPDGTERWRRTMIRNMWNPAVGPDGTVYVQAMYQAGGTGAIYAFNPGDGSRKWVYAVAEPTATKVAIAAGGTLYFGSGTHETSDEPQNVGTLYATVDCGQDWVEAKWTEPLDFGSSVGTPTIDSEDTIVVKNPQSKSHLTPWATNAKIKLSVRR